MPLEGFAEGRTATQCDPDGYRAGSIGQHDRLASGDESEEPRTGFTPDIAIPLDLGAVSLYLRTSYQAEAIGFLYNSY